MQTTEPTKPAEAQSFLTDELDTLSGFQLKAEVIRREAECQRLRKSIEDKEDIVLRLLALTEELKTKTSECERLKLKIKKVEAEARSVFKVSNGTELTGAL